MLPASSVHLAGGGGTTEINHGVPGGGPQGVEGEGQDCVAPRTHVTKAANQDHADRMCSCHWPSASCLWLLTPAKGGMWVRKPRRKPGLTPSRRRPGAPAGQAAQRPRPSASHTLYRSNPFEEPGAPH